MQKSTISIIALFGIIFNINCSQKNKVFSKNLFLERYIKYTNSVQYKDINNIDFKVLKAYYNNDTNYLKSIDYDIKLSTKNTQVFQNGIDKEKLRKVCFDSIPIDTFKYDEVYRLIETYTFGNNKLVIEIQKKEDSYYIEFESFQPSPIIRKRMPLSKEEGELVFSTILNNDFWSLSPECNMKIEGLLYHRNYIEISGYKKIKESNSNVFHKIFRSYQGRVPVNNMFEAMLKSARIKQDLWRNK